MRRWDALKFKLGREVLRSCLARWLWCHVPMQQRLLQPAVAIEKHLDTRWTYQHLWPCCGGHGTLRHGVIGGAVLVTLNTVRLCNDAYNTFVVGDFVCTFPYGCPTTATPIQLAESMNSESACNELNGVYEELYVGSDTLYETESAANDVWICVMVAAHLVATAAACFAAHQAWLVEAKHLRISFRIMLLVYCVSAADLLLRIVRDGSLCEDRDVERELACEDHIFTGGDAGTEDDLVCLGEFVSVTTIEFAAQSVLSLWYLWVVFMYEKECSGTISMLNDDDDSGAPLNRHSDLAVCDPPAANGGAAVTSLSDAVDGGEML